MNLVLTSNLWLDCASVYVVSTTDLHIMSSFSYILVGIASFFFPSILQHGDEGELSAAYAAEMQKIPHIR